MEYLGCIVAMMVVVPFVAPLSITSEGNDLTKDLRTNITLECSVNGDYNFMKNAIVWYKVVGDKKIQINDNAILKSPFKETRRYSFNSSYEQIENGGMDVRLPLTIYDLELADNGTFECELVADEISSIQYTLVIPAPISELKMDTNRTRLVEEDKMVFEFTDLEPAFVSCKSSGGNPPPELKITRGGDLINAEFTLTTSETIEGPEGLQVFTHHVELSNPEFRATSYQSGEKLKCVAKIHRMPEAKKTEIATMDVKFPPIFECDKSRFVKLPIEDFKDYIIDCVVKGNPPVASKDIFWTFFDSNGTAVNLTSVDTHGSFATQAEASGEGHLNVSLTILGMNSSHFNTYHLRAKNYIAEEHYEIYLGEVTTTTTTTTTTEAPKPINEGWKPVEGEIKDPSSGTNEGNRLLAQNMLVSIVVLMLAAIYSR